VRRFISSISLTVQVRFSFKQLTQTHTLQSLSVSRRYLNSGVWAGRAHAAVSVLEFLKSAMMFAGYSEEEFRRADDQELMALLYITLYSTAKPLIPSPFKVLDLDYNSEIVQSFQTTTEHHCNPEKGEPHVAYGSDFDTGNSRRHPDVVPRCRIC
jgi:hypothetical protein